MRLGGTRGTLTVSGLVEGKAAAARNSSRAACTSSVRRPAAIHSQLRRAADDLLEAELFGHARGRSPERWASGGTLRGGGWRHPFLDEVGEPSPARRLLLRVLQDGEVRRVGENMPRRVDARIVAATNRRLDEEVAANRFRADLRFRLDVVRIVVPPLRERASDIPALAAHFWTEAAARVGTSATLTAVTLATLARYDWPGNVRELQNVIASLAVHAPRRGRIGPAVPRSTSRGAYRRDDVRGRQARIRRRFIAGRARRHAGGCGAPELRERSAFRGRAWPR